jgi:type IV secretory pathway TrbL component
MSVGEVAGLIAAVVFAVLVGLLAIPIIKLGKVFDETRRVVAGIGDETLPLLNEVTTGVTQVNAELRRVDAITANAQAVTSNISALTGLFAATLGGPVVKVAAFSYGVRRAASARSFDRLERRLKAQRRADRAAARASRRLGGVA